MSGIEDRRPLASRQSRWAGRLARRLSRSAVTPNQISIAGIGFAAAAGLCFWAAGSAAAPGRVVLLLTAAAGCQLRLICNLMDGMVAIEGGKKTGDGAFWNEFPDRIADICIFAGIGFGVGAPALGWATACLAVLTAYTRELGRAIGLSPDYSGPMAKPQRMAVITAAAVVSLIEPLIAWRGQVLFFALWLVVLGSTATVIRRSLRIIRTLRQH